MRGKSAYCNFLDGSRRIDRHTAANRKGRLDMVLRVQRPSVPTFYVGGEIPKQFVGDLLEHMVLSGVTTFDIAPGRTAILHPIPINGNPRQALLLPPPGQSQDKPLSTKQILTSLLSASENFTASNKELKKGLIENGRAAGSLASTITDLVRDENIERISSGNYRLIKNLDGSAPSTLAPQAPKEGSEQLQRGEIQEKYLKIIQDNFTEPFKFSDVCKLLNITGGIEKGRVRNTLLRLEGKKMLKRRKDGLYDPPKKSA